MRHFSLLRKRCTLALPVLLIGAGISLAPRMAQAQGQTAVSAMAPALNSGEPPASPVQLPSSLHLSTSDSSSGPVSTAQLISPPIIQWLLGENATLTPLGIAGGLQGWLVTASGKQQVIYVTPDGKHLIAGVMASVGGEDVTALQLNTMVLGKNPSITKANENNVASSVSDPVASPAMPIQAPRSEKEGGTVPSEDGAPASSRPLAATSSVTPTSVSASSSSTGPVPPASPAVAAEVSPFLAGQATSNQLAMTPDQLVGELNHTAYFTVGEKGKPDLVMVADPNCPFCHASWTLLQPLVVQGKIDVSVVLVDVLPGSGDKAVALLSSPQIGEEWLKGEGSENGVPISTPPSGTNMAVAQKYLSMNEAFVREFYSDPKEIRTPTLFWVARQTSSSPYVVFQGMGLGGVAGFLTAVEGHQVATLDQ